MKKLAIRIACGFGIVFLVAMSTATAFRYQADRFYDRAYRLIEYQSYVRALPLMIKTVRFNPYCLTYRNRINGLVLLIGVNHRNLDYMKWAIVEGEATIRKFPHNYFAYYLVAQGYHVLGYDKEAVWYYTEAIKRHPYKDKMKERLKLLL